MSIITDIANAFGNRQKGDLEDLFKGRRKTFIILNFNFNRYKTNRFVFIYLLIIRHVGLSKKAKFVILKFKLTKI